MKVVPLGVAAAVCGVGIGAALAYYEIGEYETAFAPPPVSGTPDEPLGALEPDGPIASVDSLVHDFGTMQRGTTRSHEFVFTNTGTEPLQLTVGSSTCKCTVGEVDNRPLAPGESAPVKLEWVAKSGAGTFRQSASIITNERRRSQVRLEIEGMVTDPAGVEPKEFLIGKISADERRSASVYLASYEEDGEPLEAEAWLDEASEFTDRVTVRVEPVPVEETGIERAKSAVKITVEAGPGLPVGQLTEWIKVRTNLQNLDEDEEGASLQIPFFASVEGDVSLHGALWSEELGVLRLGKVVSSEGKESRLIVSFKGEHAAEARAEVANVDPPWLEVELDEPRDSRGKVRQFMTVRVPPGQTPVMRTGRGEDNGGVGDGDGRIRLKLNHPTMTELDIRVRFLVAE